jgi:serine/threonine-protein kinase
VDQAKWQKIQELFDAAADLPKSEQLPYLKKSCGDGELFREVAALLEQDASSSSLLDRNLADIAYESVSDESNEALLNREFGPYRILKVLGEGGMGTVYLAERQDLGSEVAIKVLRDAWLSPARRERFSLEQRTLAQLNHPSIARLYDADTTHDGTPFFVMEFVEGMPLAEYCEAHNASLAERLELFRGVGEAVVYAHQHAVIHRDLKPSNILVSPDRAVHLLDFGIAKQLEELGDSAAQTMTGLRLLTPAYASPEQIRGESLGVQTDVYSLGVILYELLAGKLPFDLANRTPAEAERLLTQTEPARPSFVARSGPHSASNIAHLPGTSKADWADLDVICMTALHKDRQRRYASVEALLRDVDHFLKQEPLEARPDTTGYRIRKFVARNTRAVAASAAVAVTIGALVVFFTVRLAYARNAALAEAARTQRVQNFMVNLFRGGDEQAGPSDDLRVVTLLDRGVQEAQSLGTDPEVQAELYEALGVIYQKLGKFDRSNELLANSLDERRRIYGSDHRFVAESLIATALLRSNQAKFDEAEELAHEGLAMSKRHLPPAHPEVARATFALGKVLEDRGQYEASIPVLEEAIRLQSAPGGVSADLAASLSELANSHFYAGHYDLSQSLNEQALAINRKLHGERHPLIADTLINLGAIQFQKGNYAECEKYNREALDVTKAWYGNFHPETADAMTILGQSLTYQKRYDEAAELLKQSLAILEKVYGPEHPRVAFALNELGNGAVRQGKLDDAEADFFRAQNIYRKVYPNGHYLIGLMDVNLAGVYMERKQFEHAESLYRDALKIYANFLPPDHLNVGIGRAKLGRALLDEKHYEDALKETQAGYDILQKKGASNPWFKNAKQDLAQEYAALHQPDLAAKYLAPVPSAKTN